MWGSGKVSQQNSDTLQEIAEEWNQNQTQNYSRSTAFNIWKDFIYEQKQKQHNEFQYMVKSWK